MLEVAADALHLSSQQLEQVAEGSQLIPIQWRDDLVVQIKTVIKGGIDYRPAVLSKRYVDDTTLR